MQTALQHAARQLARANSDSSQQEAHMLLQHVTQQSLTQVMSSLQRMLTASESAQLTECLHRRLAREPLQYILGYTTFRGRRLSVNHHVLIPRPETELLVDVALDTLSQVATSAPLVVDVGTGSGAIAVSLACEAPHTRVMATDMSFSALKLARTNIRAHDANDRVALVRGDLVSMIRPTADMVVANLPYVRTNDLSDLAPEITRHEPQSALDGGPDGLTLLRRLCADAISVLKPGGWLLLEVGDSQSEAVTRMVSGTDWDRVDIVRDLSGSERVVAARSHSARYE